MTPNGGLKTATSKVAIATESDHTASAVISIEPIVVVSPLASRNKYVNQAGRIATVTLVSNADLPQS